ncbi:MAG TPA: protoporphyrinogen oxidase [Bryobacteraceae bacterium]|nr:protoporphyrinogen oxidase [Bryobacteraceae bacterium]
MRHKTLIIGGGISGLSAAHYLSKAGIRPTLLERKPRVGGVIHTSSVQGCVLEEGPDGFLGAKPWAMNLIRELGLADQVIGSNDHSRITYILKKGKLVRLPEGLMMIVPTKVMPMALSPLLGWGSKIRMGLEILRRPKGPLPDRSVHDFLLDHYGQESIDYLAEPLLAGVYGGDPRQMSVKSVLARFADIETKYGSLTRGVLAQLPAKKGGGKGPGERSSFLLTLKGGLGQLIDALRPSADVVHADAEALEQTAGGFRVRANGDWLEAEHVVLAAPAYDAAQLLAPLQPELFQLLNGIPYTTSITLALGYQKATFDHPLNGHGFLVPKKERKYIFGCTWVGNKFDYRVPDDMVVLRCFLGGDAMPLSDPELVAAARAELRSIMGLEAEPAFYNVARWPSSMAQYTVGHEQRIARIEELMKTIPGLYLAGNAYHGIGIPDCIRMGQEAATKISAGYKPELQPA